MQTFLGTHDHAARAQAALGRAFDDYYTFAFVRNPWERLVAWYMMIVQRAALMPRDRVNRLWTYVLENAASFEDFVLNCTRTIDDVDGQKSFLYNQYDYVSDREGGIIVDFIGRYENYQADVQKLVERIGLSNVEIPHMNRSEHAHYSVYYTRRTRDIVAKRYEKDIETFGYAFEAL